MIMTLHKSDKLDNDDDLSMAALEKLNRERDKEYWEDKLLRKKVATWIYSIKVEHGER
jgi:hypothetical protein